MGSSPLISHHHHFFLLLLFFLAHSHAANIAYARNLSPAPAEAPVPATPAVVLATCVAARYPSLCVRTLSSSQLAATSSPADLAIAAVSASRASARDAATFLSRLLASSSAAAPGPLGDCLELLTDAADLLEATEGELRRATSPRQLEDALTWASAALTNQDTCVEGLREGGEDVGEGAGAVEERVSGVSQYISNALHLIDRLASARGTVATSDRP